MELNRIANLLTCRWITLTPVLSRSAAVPFRHMDYRVAAVGHSIGQHNVGGDSMGTQRLWDNAVQRLHQQQQQQQQ